MSALQFASICGRIAPVASIVVFMAPFPTIQKIKRDRSVGNLPLLPYSSMASSAFLWFTYGLMKADPNVWVTNLVGLAFASYYFFQFVQFAPKSAPTLPGSVKQHVQGFAAIFTTATVLNLSGLSIARDIIGIATVILCLAMFASPLAALKVVVQTKSSEAIPLPFTLASVVNCFAWAVYGLFIMNDPNVYVTNALGLSFTLAQLALIFVYPAKGKSAPTRALSHDALLPM
jgi:solute carrier family 50 protein (sugar transporter)